MTLADFNSSGYVRLSQFFRIETAEQALALADFMGEGDEVLDAFYVDGPGTYYIFLDKGWDRYSETFTFIIRKVPQGVLTPQGFLRKLNELKQELARAEEPLLLYRTVKTQADYHTLTPEQRATLSAFDHDAYEKAKQALNEFLET